jgi:hypothetical protein
MRACKLSMVTLLIISFCLTICAALSSNIWLSKWTDRAKVKAVANDTSSWNSQIHDMNIYSALGIAQGNRVCLNKLFYSLFSIFEVSLRLSCS